LLVDVAQVACAQLPGEMKQTLATFHRAASGRRRNQTARDWSRATAKKPDAAHDCDGALDHQGDEHNVALVVQERSAPGSVVRTFSGAWVCLAA
jgi:hypothetical protein